ncbi:MAG: LptA/OstA family protein, partial [Desulfobacterales bacterium]
MSHHSEFTAAVRPPAAAGRKVGRTPLARLCIFLSIFLGLVRAGGTCGAQNFEGFLNRLNRDDTQLPWIIDADTLRFDEVAQRYVAEGHVVITKGDRVITADRVQFDQKNMTARAEGQVKVTTGGDFLTGSRVELDLEKKTGTVYD